MAWQRPATIVASGPGVLAGEVALPPHVGAGDVDRTLTLDVADYLRYRVVRRERDQDMLVIAYHLPLLDLALPLPRQFAQHRTQLAAQVAKNLLLTVLRNLHDVVLAHPFRVG
jgi:hypothetical protein